MASFYQGLNNDYFNKTNAAVAHRYLGKSVLENFHASTAFSFLKQPEHHFLCHWVEGDVVELNDTIVKLVLATDMKRHFEHIKMLKTHVEQAQTAAALRSNARGRKSVVRKCVEKERRASRESRKSTASLQSSSEFNTCFSDVSQPAPLVIPADISPHVAAPPPVHASCPVSPYESLEYSGEEDDGSVCTLPLSAVCARISMAARRRVSVDDSMCEDIPPASSGTIEAAITNDDVRMTLMSMVLKAADLGHLARPTTMHRNWVEALQEEFWMQGDRELQMGMAASPMFDRFAGERIGASQVGFIEVVALPLFTTLVKAVPFAKTQLDAAQANRDYWISHQEPGRYRQKWTMATRSVLLKTRSSKDGLQITLPSLRAGLRVIPSREPSATSSVSTDDGNEGSRRVSPGSMSPTSDSGGVGSHQSKSPVTSGGEDEHADNATPPPFEFRRPESPAAAEGEEYSSSGSKRMSRFSAPGTTTMVI